MRIGRSFGFSVAVRARGSLRYLSRSRLGKSQGRSVACSWNKHCSRGDSAIRCKDFVSVQDAPVLEEPMSVQPEVKFVAVMAIMSYAMWLSQCEAVFGVAIFLLLGP